MKSGPGNFPAAAMVVTAGIAVAYGLSCGAMLAAPASAPVAARSGAQPERATPSAVTYTRDIAPVVFAKCGVCHQPGGSAPFSLLTYSSARQHAKQMAVATRTGAMPPWKADPDEGGDFIGQPHLTDREIGLIEAWANTGAPEGDPRDLPPAPRSTNGWQLGEPDLVVRPPAYTLPPDGTDAFRIFVIRLPVDGVRFVRGMEFRPGSSGVVHHANIRIDRTASSRKFDEADPAPGYDGLIAHSAGYPDGHFLGWTPGQVPPLLPKGLAWRLSPGTDLVVELHMQPTGKAETVQPTIGFYFGSDPPERTPEMLRLGRQNIDIPAGEGRYTVTDSFVLPVDVELLAVQPHAHHRARDIEGVATLPDGSTRRLIHISDWDFRWQHVFRYPAPLPFPKGTTLAMRYIYDNSSGNPRNPEQPPKRVVWGQRSGDEMGDLWLQVLTKNDRDLQVLDEHFRPKVVAEDIVGYETWLKSEPDSVALHDDLAMLYLEVNQPGDAVRHFTASVALKPQSAPAHFNLGTALTVAGRGDEAIAEYRTALDLNPDYALAHNNLGSILLRRGQNAEAIAHLTRALVLDPTNAQAHYNVGIALRQRGENADAIRHLQQALKAGESPAVLGELASVLITAAEQSVRNPAQAVRYAERAADLTGRTNAAFLDLLAAAYASAGNFTGAVEAGEAALRLSPSDSAAVQGRVDRYRRGVQ